MNKLTGKEGRYENHWKSRISIDFMEAQKLETDSSKQNTSDQYYDNLAAKSTAKYNTYSVKNFDLISFQEAKEDSDHENIEEVKRAQEIFDEKIWMKHCSQINDMYCVVWKIRIWENCIISGAHMNHEIYSFTKSFYKVFSKCKFQFDGFSKNLRQISEWNNDKYPFMNSVREKVSLDSKAIIDDAIQKIKAFLEERTEWITEQWLNEQLVEKKFNAAYWDLLKQVPNISSIGKNTKPTRELMHLLEYESDKFEELSQSIPFLNSYESIQDTMKNEALYQIKRDIKLQIDTLLDTYSSFETESDDNLFEDDYDNNKEAEVKNSSIQIENRSEDSQSEFTNPNINSSDILLCHNMILKHAKYAQENFPEELQIWYQKLDEFLNSSLDIFIKMKDFWSPQESKLHEMLIDNLTKMKLYRHPQIQNNDIVISKNYPLAHIENMNYSKRENKNEVLNYSNSEDKALVINTCLDTIINKVVNKDLENSNLQNVDDILALYQNPKDFLDIIKTSRSYEDNYDDEYDDYDYEDEFDDNFENIEHAK